MGSIQQNVNSMLASAAVLTGLGINSPAIKAKTELNSLKREEGVIAGQLKAQAEAVRKNPGSSPEEMAGHLQRQVDIGKKLEKNYERRFHLDPTEKNYNQYSGVQEVNKASEAKLKAFQSMYQAQDEKRNRIPIYGAHGEVING